jgi:hypothetical protein
MEADRELISETRWTRIYALKDGEAGGYVVSRFLSGDATITVAQLGREWHTWSVADRIDFCQSFSAGGDSVPERTNILRYVAIHGDHICWPAIANAVARHLPHDESMPILRAWCQTCSVGHGANYYQAVALTADPDAHDLLKKCFARTWLSTGLMDDADFMNWVAYDALCCVRSLLELNEDPTPYRSAYETLKLHPCRSLREDAQRWLCKYFEGGRR